MVVAQKRIWLQKLVAASASTLGLVGILAFSGCSSEHNADDQSADDRSPDTRSAHELGGLGLGLVLPDGSNVGGATYTITNPSDPAFAPISGSLTISGNVATATVAGLVAEGGYTVMLRATRSSPAGAPDCTGSATFTVLANQTVNLNVVLPCDDTSTASGRVTINGSFNTCPKPGPTTATDGVVNGAPVIISARVTDKEGSVGVTGFEASPDGWFPDDVIHPDGIRYHCETPGIKTITLTAMDLSGCHKAFPPITVTCSGTGRATNPYNPPVQPPPPTCDSCLTANCSLYQGYDPILSLCTTAACDEAFACFQRNHCAVDGPTVNQCYCGIGVTNDTCLTLGYVAVGPCAALANSTFGSSNTQEVISRLYDESTQFGVGATLFACAADLCTAECVTGNSIRPVR